jgi:hypothetical protein
VGWKVQEQKSTQNNASKATFRESTRDFYADKMMPRWGNISGACIQQRLPESAAKRLLARKARNARHFSMGGAAIRSIGISNQTKALLKKTNKKRESRPRQPAPNLHQQSNESIRQIFHSQGRPEPSAFKVFGHTHRSCSPPSTRHGSKRLHLRSVSTPPPAASGPPN